MENRNSIHISTFQRPSLVDINSQTMFEPTRDIHSWNKWRMAVNNKLVDNTKLREQHKQLNGFSHSLSRAPYSECLLVTKNTRQDAHGMMVSKVNDTNKKGMLQTGQFIYYGIPRLSAKSTNDSKLQTTTLGNDVRNYEMIFLNKRRN